MKVDKTLIDKDKLAALFESMDKKIDLELAYVFSPSEYDIFLSKKWSINELPDLGMFDPYKYGKVDDEEYFQIAVNKGLLKNRTSEEILMLAIKGNSLKYLKIAIQLGANVNSYNFQYTYDPYYDSSTFTPIKYACQLGNINIVKYLVECGADIFKSKIEPNYSTLEIASEYGNLDVVKFLVESGFDVNAREVEYGLLPLEIAIYYNRYNVAKYLLEQGAEKELHNRVLIQKTLEEGCLEFVKLFIEFGANVNHQDEIGDSALHEALSYENFELAKFLVENGADIYLPNKEGETPMDIARRDNDDDIFKYIAREEKNDDMLKYLKQVDRSIKLKKLKENIKNTKGTCEIL